MKQFDWHITDEAGKPLAYKESGKEIEVFDLKAAIAKVQELIDKGDDSKVLREIKGKLEKY